MPKMIGSNLHSWLLSSGTENRTPWLSASSFAFLKKSFNTERLKVGHDYHSPAGGLTLNFQLSPHPSSPSQFDFFTDILLSRHKWLFAAHKKSRLPYECCSHSVLEHQRNHSPHRVRMLPANSLTAKVLSLSEFPSLQKQIHRRALNLS